LQGQRAVLFNRRACRGSHGFFLPGVFVDDRWRSKWYPVSTVGKWTLWLSSRTAGDGRHEQDFVAGLQGAAFATEEPNIFLIEIDVQELTDLALLVADMPAEAGKLCRQNIQRLGNRCRITVKLRPSVGKPPKCSRNFNRNSHFFSLGRRQIFMR